MNSLPTTPKPVYHRKDRSDLRSGLVFFGSCRSSRLRCWIGYNDAGSTRPNRASLFASIRSFLRLRRFDPSINRGLATSTSCPQPRMTSCTHAECVPTSITTRAAFNPFPPVPPALLSYSAAPGPATSHASTSVHYSFESCYPASSDLLIPSTAWFRQLSVTIKRLATLSCPLPAIQHRGRNLCDRPARVPAKGDHPFFILTPARFHSTKMQAHPPYR
jgi:hypothetical protein